MLKDSQCWRPSLTHSHAYIHADHCTQTHTHTYAYKKNTHIHKYTHVHDRLSSAHRPPSSTPIYSHTYIHTYIHTHTHMHNRLSSARRPLSSTPTCVQATQNCWISTESTHGELTISVLRTPTMCIPSAWIWKKRRYFVCVCECVWNVYVCVLKDANNVHTKRLDMESEGIVCVCVIVCVERLYVCSWRC